MTTSYPTGVKRPRYKVKREDDNGGKVWSIYQWVVVQKWWQYVGSFIERGDAEFYVAARKVNHATRSVQ